MFKPIPFVFALLMLTTKALAQGENNIWIFGEHQGLNFNNTPPTLYPTGMMTFKAAASVCDPAGNLLFFTNSTTVYDRNAVAMPNGGSLTGNTNATQGAAIVRSFTNPNQYYVFTISGTHKLYYSVVDLSLNFGNGDVVTGQKNILRDSNISEKMMVIRGIDCIWVLVHMHSYKEFHAFRVDASGVSTSSVISNTGFYDMSNYYLSGQMNVSPDWSKLVLANYNNTTVELYSFDNIHGTVYNPIMLDSLPPGKVYGACFSPDNSRLYVSKNQNNGLYQYDVSLLPNTAAVLASKTQIDGSRFGEMRIGPDNKIYITILTLQYALGVINNPNAPGLACNYTGNVYGPYPKGQAFETGLGVPYVPYCAPSTAKTDTTVCFAAGGITVSAPPGYTSYQWSDSTLGATNYYNAAATKWVYSYNGCNLLIDTITAYSQPKDTTSSLMKDTTVCFVNNIPLFAASAGYTSYLWSDGFTQQQDTFSAPGTKLAYGLTGCTVHVDTFITHAGFDTSRVLHDTTLCVAYIPRVLAAPSGFTSYLWSDGHTTQTDTFMASATKWVQEQNICLLRIDTFHFHATNIPQDSIFTRTTDSTICFEATPSLVVSAPTGYTDYLWNDGVPGMNNTFNTPGTKWVYAQTGCLMLVDTFGVFGKMTDTTSHFNDTDVCFSKSLTVTAVDGYLTYMWNNGNSTPINTITSTSVNWVYMHKACGERIDTFKVRLVDALAVSLGADTALCKGESIRLDATSVYPDASYLWQDNSRAANYTASSGGTYWVKVTVGKCSIADTIRIQDKKLKLDLGDGKVPCGQDALILDAGADRNTYSWQDGSSGRTITVRTDGTYSVHVVEGTCSADAKIDVTFEPCPCVIYIPNAFTPNKDGLNDFFGPTISCPISGYEMRIFNRWGNIVFYSDNLQQRWDGSYKATAQDHDLFYYYIQFKDAGGHNYYYKGDVTLVK